MEVLRRKLREDVNDPHKIILNDIPEWKKVIENPSGPRALSNGMSSIASLISDSEKGRSKSSKE
jgi:hypothetical protein